jgi:hypothetical protein
MWVGGAGEKRREEKRMSVLSKLTPIFFIDGDRQNGPVFHLLVTHERRSDRV